MESGASRLTLGGWSRSVGAMRRISLAVAFIVVLGAGCGIQSDEEQIRLAVQQSAHDEVHAHDRDPAEWCDTRLVAEGRSDWKNLLERLDSGRRGPTEEQDLRAAASEARCLDWVERYTEQLRKLDEDSLRAEHGSVEITDVRIHGDVARVDSYEGEYEEPRTRDWVLIKLEESDWRVFASGEVAFLTPTTDWPADE
jgi:hypothetical protein